MPQFCIIALVRDEGYREEGGKRGNTKEEKKRTWENKEEKWHRTEADRRQGRLQSEVSVGRCGPHRSLLLGSTPYDLSVTSHLQLF